MTANDSVAKSPATALTVTPEPDTLPDAIRAVLTIHVADSDDRCLGCLDAWARLAPVPCPIARWAVSMLESHAAATGATAPADADADCPRQAGPGGPRQEHPLLTPG